VQGGETVGQIAQRYHVSRPSLMQQNEMQTGRLQAGQRLSVPAATYVGNSEIVADAGARPIRVRYGSRATRPVAVDAMPTADASASTRDGFVPAASRR
jgi:LysM repeat protein